MRYDQHWDGSRWADSTPWFAAGTGPATLYYYDGLGQMTGTRIFHPSELPQNRYWEDHSGECAYDGLGRRISPCRTDGWLGYDGENTIWVYGVGGPTWRFAQGPGLDDPLVGLYQVSAGVYKKYYFLTDGESRLLAFTDTAGTDQTQGSIYTSLGGADAGAISKAQTFDNSRSEAAAAPHLSYYRNRYYDQATGRWTQEDPIGVAGGLNLYAYVGNNPATYTDPFGLCPPDNDNTADCPDTDLGHAWQILDESKSGRKVIKRYVKSKPKVDTDISRCKGANCTDPDRTSVHVSGTSAAMAVGLSHEIVHVQGHAVYGTWDYINNEEIPAWQSAFGVYDAMSREEKDASGYTARREWWRDHHENFITQIICQTLQPRPPACP